MATSIISLLSFSTAHNSFEQDNNNLNSSIVEQQSIPQLRIRTNSVSIHDNNSPIGSMSSSPPLSMSPKSHAAAEGALSSPYLHRRYTISLPSSPPLADNRDEKKHNSPGSIAYRIPTARFWEIGAREDSSVQVAMENVQFGL
ncbi:1444_t:CDS:2 [Ambispora gerdemannii]|uniref:1444_t:CDS:1 n=1 Tax=Ambispora gerdemannii TaxID=144530 RepID=A0A9N8V870_9GLOM|nr:1444_t:CDS:2 [Ambispora gerdemannii]